ncbi:hypothetical protein KY334_04210 [Candidatus Woesearchaeota archaeon]|nr:hypothetical protein [Candidatus Woesearchaeota archaeon]
MILDKVLRWALRISITLFMISALLIVIGDNLVKNLVFSVTTLYAFIAISYINQMRKNGVNEEKITQQVIGIVLGTVLMIIVISLMFKLIGALTSF